MGSDINATYAYDGNISISDDHIGIDLNNDDPIDDIVNTTSNVTLDYCKVDIITVPQKVAVAILLIAEDSI